MPYQSPIQKRGHFKKALFTETIRKMLQIPSEGESDPIDILRSEQNQKGPTGMVRWYVLEIRAVPGLSSAYKFKIIANFSLDRQGCRTRAFV